MELMIDIILIAATFTAIIYCYVLNNRLKTLKGAASTLGSTIASLSETVEQARATVILAKESSAEGVDELTPLVREANDLVPEMTALVDVISDVAETKIAEIKDLSESVRQEIDEKIQEMDAVVESAMANKTVYGALGNDHDDSFDEIFSEIGDDIDTDGDSDDFFAAPVANISRTNNTKGASSQSDIPDQAA